MVAEKPKKKKRHIGLIILSMIILFVGIVFFRTQWVENYLAHKLIERTSAESDGFYNLSYKRLSISFWNGELKIEGVKLIPDSAVFNDWQAKDSLPNTYMNLSIDMIHFKGLNLTWRHNFKKLHFTSFQIKTPNVAIFQTNDLNHPKKKKHHASTKNLYQMVSAYITELSVNQLNLDNASIQFTAINPQSPIVYSIQNVSLDAYGFLMNEQTYEDGKPLFCDSFKFTTNQPQQLITNNDFTLSTDSISLNTADSVIYISKIDLVSNRKNPGYPENFLDASVKTVSINGIQLTRDEAINSLRIRSFNIIEPEIETSHIAKLSEEKKQIEEDKPQKEKEPNVLESPLTIYDIISPIFHRLMVGEIDIDKAKMQYTLYTEKGKDHFKMDELTFKAFDLVVDSVSTSNSQYLFSQNFMIDISGLSGEMESSNHYISVSKLVLNSTDGNLLIDDVELKPISTSSKKDYFIGSIESLSLAGLNYKHGIEIESFIINRPNIEYTLITKSDKEKEKKKPHTKKNTKQVFENMFSPVMNHLSLNDFRISNANVVIVDDALRYQLKDFDVYATHLLLSENSKSKEGYSFSYGKMGFSFHSFDNCLPGNEYRLVISQGSYSTTNELLSLKDILLIPQDTLFAKSKSNLRFATPLLTIAGLDYTEKNKVKDISFDKLSIITPQVAINEKSGDKYSFSFADFEIDKAAWNEELLRIDAIELIKPVVDIATIAKEKEKKEKHKSEGLPKLTLPDKLYHSLSGIAQELSLGRFVISDALVSYTSQEKDTTIHLKLDTTNFSICDIQLNCPQKSFTWARPYFSTINVKYPLDKGLYDIAAKKIELINDSLYLDNVSYTSPYSKMEFSYVDPKHKSWNHLTIAQIALLGIDYKALLEENRVQMSSMAIDDITLENFMNQKTKIPHHKWYPMIYSYLQKAPIAVYIPVIDVKDFTVIYQELSKKGTEPGTLLLQDLTGTITNVTNIVNPAKPYMIASMEGKMMGKADFSVVWEIPVDSLNDHFVLKAHVGEFDLREMNKLVSPIVPLEIKSGQLKQMTLHAEASSKTAKADMLLQYENLYAEIDKEKDGEVKESRFVTKIANKILKHENEDKHAITEIERDPYHPTFNYIWQIMEPALVESVGISVKEQEKAIKTIGFLDRVIHFFHPKSKRIQLKYPDLIIPDNQ